MPFRDFKVLEKVSREMEKKYALKLDLGRADKIEPEKQAARARDKEAHTWEQSFDSYVRAEAADLLAALYAARGWQDLHAARSSEHPSELQSIMRISYDVFCLHKTNYKPLYDSNQP